MRFTLALLALWVMGCVYNIPPVRSKDLPYVDVLSEAINNPIRMLAGWFIVSSVTVAPAIRSAIVVSRSGRSSAGCRYDTRTRSSPGTAASAGRRRPARRAVAAAPE